MENGRVTPEMQAHTAIYSLGFKKCRAKEEGELLMTLLHSF